VRIPQIPRVSLASMKIDNPMAPTRVVTKETESIVRSISIRCAKGFALLYLRFLFQGCSGAGSSNCNALSCGPV